MSMTSSRSVNRSVALLLSILLVLSLLTSALSRRAYAEPYVPPQIQNPGYTGPLSWVDYTPPLTTIPTMDYTIPFSLAIDNSDNIYVARSRASVSAATYGKVEKIAAGSQTPNEISENADLAFARAIAVDKDGNVYVTNNTKDFNVNFDPTNPNDPNNPNGQNYQPNVASIKVLPHGTTTWGDLPTAVAGEDPIKSAIGIAVDRWGTLYAIDSYFMSTNPNLPHITPRVLKLTSGANEWTNINGTKSFESLLDVAVDGAGNVFVLAAGTSSSEIYKLKSNGTWDNLTPTNNPFIAFGLGVDKFDRLLVMNLFDAKVMILEYGQDAGHWTTTGIMAKSITDLSNFYFDVAGDSQGFIYAPSIYSGNVTRLMAALIYNGNMNAGGAIPSEAVGYLPNGTATVLGNTGNLTKPGFTFGGWSTSQTGTGTTYSAGDTINMTQSITLYAIWNPIPTYTVTFQAGTGGVLNGLSQVTVSGGNTISTVPTPVPDPDYTFIGWSNDGKQTLLNNTDLANTVVTGNATYTAYFQPPVTLTRIDLDSTSYTLSPGTTHQTVVTAVYSNDIALPLTAGVTFTSSEPGVATVNGDGLVTALADGQTVISAEYQGQQAQANVIVQSPPEPPPVISGPAAPVTTKPGVDVFVDGVKQEQLATLKEEQVDGRTVTTIMVDSQKVTEKMDKDNNKLLTIPLTGEHQVVVGQLTGDLVGAMESKEASIQIVTDRGTYTIPASQINIGAITEKLGSGVKPEDITISIQISAVSADKADQTQSAAARGQMELIGLPVDFEITASYGTQTVQVNQFNNYVERTIALPDGVDPSKVTTGVVLSDNGELNHVPTSVTQKDGKYYAQINSLTNSTYSVIYNQRELSDVQDHWAKADVNDMSSRLIVQGVTATEFRPDASITRAEFAAIVTRGLGIQPAASTGAFKDVDAAAWYAGAVQAAVQYKLIDGYEDGTFRPNQNISRQEATAVLSRAAGIANLKPALSSDEAASLLAKFTDGRDVAGWAQSSVAAAIHLNLMNGRGDKLDLEANLTRAETAALVRRLLQAAHLIN